MNVSLNWLATHLDLRGKSPDELDELLTFAGVEVENIEIKGVRSEQIVVAEIKEAEPHPNADRLKVTQVDAGEGALRQIVCGAKNYQVGDKVPCALPGAQLPGGFAIKEAKMRGVESRGMLCAADEIGLPKGEDGLLILDREAAPGALVRELFANDVQLEVEVTPNRPDLLSHYGMARELAVLLETPLVALEIPSWEQESKQDVRIEDPEGCPFYTAVPINGIQKVDTPDWLAERLESIGLRPINPVVDVTNFVLHELGQPLHAFDAAKVTGDLVVRAAQSGEVFKALDGETYELSGEDCVISDDSGAVLALAGVMGGLESGVTEETTDVLLESAFFTPSRIRRTARRLGLGSDSSYRFERRVDPGGVAPASALAARLIREITGGTAETTLRVAGELPALPKSVRLDATRLDQLTGNSISHADAASILERLGLGNVGDGSWEIPTFRSDLTRHIDLVEEIARVYGLARIPSRTAGAFVPSSRTDAEHDRDMELRRALAALGMHEIHTIKLISEQQLSDILPLKPIKEGDLIRVSHPLSEDHSVMRPSLTPGLLACAAHNVHQGASALRFYEIGRTFQHAGGGKARDLESSSLGLLLAGPDQPDGWDNAPRPTTLHDLLGLLEALLPNAQITLSPRDWKGFALGNELAINGSKAGRLAAISPARARELDLPLATWVAEIDLLKVHAAMQPLKQVDALPQFPESTRDASLELDQNVRNEMIRSAIEAVKEPLLQSYECFDRFHDPSGEKMDVQRYAVSYRFHYRAEDRTLKSKEVDQAHQQILQHLTEKTGATMR